MPTTSCQCKRVLCEHLLGIRDQSPKRGGAAEISTGRFIVFPNELDAFRNCRKCLRTRLRSTTAAFDFLDVGSPRRANSRIERGAERLQKWFVDALPSD